MSHTKEPWYYSEDNYICQDGVTDAGIAHVLPYDDGQRGIKSAYGEITEANARRIVACVNACAGVSNEELEAGLPSLIHDLVRKMAELERQKAELVEALNKYGDHRPSCTFYPSDPDMIDPLSNQCTCGLEQALAAHKVSV